MIDEKEKARRRRDAAIAVQLGDADKDGAIREAISMPDGLYAVSDHAIHRMVMAGMIDPELQHVNTPHVHQRVAQAGTDNEIVRRTLLQADRLFRKQYLDEAQGDAAKVAVLAAMQELLAAENILTKLRDDMVAAEVDLPDQHKGTMALPSIGDVDARGKSFVQRVEHALQAAFRLSVAFFGDTRKPGFFDGVAANVRERFAQDAGFIAFADSMATFAKLVRGLRHCIEHRKPGQRLDLLDYHFDAGQMHRPTIRVDHRDVPFKTLPLDQFMELMISSLVDAVESLTVFLAGSHVTSFGKMPIGVGEHPHFGEGNIRVRFTYLIGMGDPPQWMPLG